MLSSHHEAMLPYAPRPPSLLVDRRYKQGGEAAPNCPRCDSPNTKFCYYNNYSLSQPRYFCKGCRRYWTKGGSLRNVPVGGGCRKNRRGKSSVRSAAESIASGRDAAFGHRFPGPVRPDLVLEGMVGNPANPGQAIPDVPAAADGSTIDLAMLYAKFLNNPAAEAGVGAVTLESGGQVDEAFDTFSASSDLQSPGGVLAPAQQFDPCHDGFGEWSGPVSSTDPTSTASTTTTTTMLCSDVSVQAALGELNFGMDQSCFDSLGLPTDVGNLSSWCSIVPSLSTLEDTKYESLDSFPDDALSLHESMISGPDSHDYWSVDCQGLEALYMP